MLRPFCRTLQPMRNHFLWFAKEIFFEVAPDRTRDTLNASQKRAVLMFLSLF
jgi:hypothetical protein